MFKRLPISRFVCPKQARATTSCSRAVRECHLFHSLSLETYWVRPASRISGSNSSSGRPSCFAIVLRVTCRDSLISYFREPDAGRLPILPNSRCQIDILNEDYSRTSVLWSRQISKLHLTGSRAYGAFALLPSQEELSLL